MIVKVFIGLATAAIFSAVAAHQPIPSTVDARSAGPQLEAFARNAFPVLAKGDRLGPPASQPSITVEHRTGENTSVLIRMPASRLASR